MYMSFEIKKLPIKEIGTDCYQRRIYPERVESIADEFDERLVDLPRVCWRNGVWECWNGHHTINVLRKLGYTHVDCIVAVVKTTQEAASLYTRRNNGRFSKPLTPPEDFSGRRIAEDEIVHDIDAIIEKHGFKFGKSKASKTICSVQTLETVYKKHGRDVLSDTLEVIAACYANEPSATNSVFISGLAYFIKRSEDGIKLALLKKRLSQTNADDIITEVGSSRMFKGVKAYESVFRTLYGAKK
jgi:hypothetical protein